MLVLILLVFALVLAIIGASPWIPDPYRGRLIAASLAFYYGYILAGGIK